MCVQQPTSRGVHRPSDAGGSLLLARVPGEALEGGQVQGGVQPPGCAAGRLGSCRAPARGAVVDWQAEAEELALRRQQNTCRTAAG